MRADLTVTTVAAIESRATPGVLGFETFYRAQYPSMVRLAVLLVDRHDLAEEIVQEAFAAVYLKWNRVAAPAGYVRRAVVNRCRDVQRWRRRRRRDEGVDEPTVGPSEPVDHVRAAIVGLPARQRMAIVLRFYEDLTVDEIAAAMGARPGTVKSLLHRGIAALREEIPDDH